MHDQLVAMCGQQRAMAYGWTVWQSVTRPKLVIKVVLVKHRVTRRYTIFVGNRILQHRVMFANYIEYITIHHSCSTLPYMSTSKLRRSLEQHSVALLLPIRTSC